MDAVWLGERIGNGKRPVKSEGAGAGTVRAEVVVSALLNALAQGDEDIGFHVQVSGSGVDGG